MTFQHTFAAGTRVWLDQNGKTTALLDIASSLTVDNVETAQQMAELLAGTDTENWRLNNVGLEYTTLTDHHVVFGGHAIPVDRGSSSVSSSVSSSASSSVSSSSSSSVSSSTSSSVSHSVSSSVSSSASASSDARLKDNVVPITGVLEKVRALRWVSFEWNHTAGRVGKVAGTKGFGVIAQELELLFPDLVSTDEIGYKRVNYEGLYAMLGAALSEQLAITEQPHALAAGSAG